MDNGKDRFKTILSWLDYKEKKDTSFHIPAADTVTPAEPDKSIDKKPCGKPGSDRGKTHTRNKSQVKPLDFKPVRMANRSAEARMNKNNDGKGGNNQNTEDAGKQTSTAVGDKLSDPSDTREDPNACIAAAVEDNINQLKKAFNLPNNKDVIIRRLCLANGTAAFIFYIDGMADRDTINLSILRPLLDKSKFQDLQGKNLFDFIFDSVIETHELEKIPSLNNVVKEVLTGNTGVFIDGFPYYILCETKGYEKRSVDKPQVEGVVKGPQEAFNENLRTNITLIRRILKNHELTTEFYDMGKRNNAKCAVIYINKLVNPAIVSEVVRRIKGISTDLIIGEGILEQFIEDTPFSLIPTMLSTERPDRTVSQLVEGKVVIMAEGTPFALIVPVTIADFLHSPEDTWLRWQFGTFLRLIRFFALFISCMLPGIYVALTTFHDEMIPTDLLIAIAKARENVPFPTILEVLIMEISFELIREAGIRIPGIIGNTIGIIGALILGQAAVQANLVSPVLIIVVASTGLGSFAIPDFNLAFGVRILRFFFIVLGATLGFYGISLGILAVLAVLVSLNSFGVPLFSAVAPKTNRSYDWFIRWPVWKQEYRPDYLNPLDIKRQPKISRKWTLVQPSATAGKNQKANFVKQPKNSGRSGRKDNDNEQ